MENSSGISCFGQGCRRQENRPGARMEYRMKTVIAIDSFKGSMTSMEAGNAAAAGVKAVFPDAEIPWAYLLRTAGKARWMH